ncbi:MAG: hypothetical protein ABMA02_13285 [Saprospiraceae bacterium]
MKHLALLALLFAATHVQADCFYPLYSDGKAACERREFKAALKYLEAARSCPDKPRYTDLEDWIARARSGRDERNAWNRALESDNQETWQLFLSHFPDGYYRTHAEELRTKRKMMLNKSLVQQTSIGAVNWTQDVVEATGEVGINLKKWPDEAQAIQMATRSAEVVARANLLEAIAGIQVRRETSVRDLMTESDEVHTYISGIVRSAGIFGNPRIGKEAVIVVMRVPLYGPGGVASVVLSPEPGPYADTTETDPEPIEWTLVLPSGTVPPFTLFPVFADAQGNVLLDGSVPAGAAEVPLARWYRSWPSEFIPGKHVFETTLDSQSRLVLPDTALPVFRQWQDMRRSGKGVLPVRVVLR